MTKKEAQARVKIDLLLQQAGWRFFDDAGGKANISCEHRVTKKTYRHSELGEDFQNAENGFIDYLLLNDQKRPIALVEAKKESINPLDAKEQARVYARSINIRHIFLSNGNLHYYWDLEQGNPTRISKFLTIDELGEAIKWNPDPEKLIAVEADENYIALSQDPQWNTYTADQKATAKIDKNIRVLRDYQVAGVKALQNSYAKGKRRFLFEMATGTGKTLLSAAVAKLFIRSGNADRVLFLVDRIELEKQAHKNFRDYLANDGINTVIYKENRHDWINAQVVITTIQSLSAGNKYLSEFSPNDFQLIISDEAHRTIGGNNRVIFEYFIGSKLGLTATPRDYLKGVDVERLTASDPRQLEKRMLLDTYQTFGCEDGIPTFRFSLLDAVQHNPPYLVNPKTIDCRTDVTTELLTQEGWATVLTTEDNEQIEESFYKQDFERKFFSPETNLTFIRTFLKHAKRDPLTGEIGKSIFFCVSINHAAKLTKMLNDETERMYPGVYNSDFAVQITSNIPGSQKRTMQFTDESNNLNGHTRFKPEMIDYKSSKTRVCVTVGMMTTGYDCQDLLNVVLCRPIFSPTDFIQIKGRGTRLFNFVYENVSDKTERDKDNFYLFDFFANCEFFEHEYNYGEKIKLPRPGTGGIDPPPPPPPDDNFLYSGPDDLATLAEEQIGTQGMRVDREAFSKNFENKTKEEVEKHPELVKAVEQEDWEPVEEFVKEKIYNKPKEYWTTDKLREAYGISRRLTLTEILQKIFGKIDRFKEPEDFADESFDRFLSIEGIDGSKKYELRNLFLAYLLNPEIRNILDKKNYGELSTSAELSFDDLKKLGKDQIEITLNYIKDNISLDQYRI